MLYSLPRLIQDLFSFHSKRPRLAKRVIRPELALSLALAHPICVFFSLKKALSSDKSHPYSEDVEDGKLILPAKGRARIGPLRRTFFILKVQYEDFCFFEFLFFSNTKQR